MSRRSSVPAAHAALTRGIAFARAGAARGGPSPAARVAGNILAELDRLLHILIGQVALDRRVTLPARSRDTASRLAALVGAHPHGDRLRALARSTACLRRHDGRARHADRRGCGFMTIGWHQDGLDSPRLGRVAIGEVLMPSPGQIDEICAFYDALARRSLRGRDDIRVPRVPHGQSPLLA